MKALIPKICANRSKVVYQRIVLRFASDMCKSEHVAKCPRCGSDLNCCCSLFCTSEACLRVQKLDQTICNYYDLFNLGGVRYNIPSEVIDTNFRNLQKKIHPDKFASKEDETDKNLSQENSAFINKAHAVLKSPLERASYILRMNGINIDEEGKIMKKSDLMMEMFELREEIEDLPPIPPNITTTTTTIQQQQQQHIPHFSSSSSSSSNSSISPQLDDENNELLLKVQTINELHNRLLSMKKDTIEKLHILLDETREYLEASQMAIRLKYILKAIDEFYEKYPQLA